MRGGQGQEVRAEMWVSEAPLHRDPEMEEGAQGERRERGWEDAWSNGAPPPMGTHMFCFPLTFLPSGQDLEVPALCCSQNRAEGERGKPKLNDRKARTAQSIRVPSWSLAAPVLPEPPPAECHFAIYLHVIIAMRCRY